MPGLPPRGKARLFPSPRTMGSRYDSSRLMNHRWRRHLAAVLVGGLILGIAGCATRRTDPVCSGWSRGLPIATADVGDAPALAASAAARWVVWRDATEGEPGLMVGRIGSNGVLTRVGTIGIPAQYPHSPRLLLHEGEPILFLLFRTDAGINRLAVQRLSEEGRPVGELIPLSPEDHDVASYAVAQTPGGFVAVWGEGERGLYSQVIPRNLQPNGFPELLAPMGRNPAVAQDRSGSIHAVWLVPPAPGVVELHYGVIASDGSTKGDSRCLGKVTGGLGALILSPALTVAQGWAYAALSVDYRGGLRAGMVETHIFAVPPEGAGEVRKLLVHVPPLLPESYADLGDGLRMDPVAPDPAPGTSVRAIGGYPRELDVGIIAVAAKLSSLRREEYQPALVFLRDGREVGWSPVAITNGSPVAVELTQSTCGWHVAWVDMHASRDYTVVYAATCPGERAVLDRFSAADFVHVLLTALSGLAAGLAALPLFILAGVPGLIVVAGHYILGGEGDLRGWGARTLLALGVVPYAGLKLLFLAMTVGEFPFAQWLSPGVAELMSILLPIMFLGAAAVAVGAYWRRSDDPGLLPAYVLFVLVDSGLSLLLVGPSLAGG